ncbi:hypothetical protein K2W90_02785 [Candidatus Babeliales bacterium]|nr:hypothetical protein [Candidatus Babeliales bacterium]
MSKFFSRIFLVATALLATHQHFMTLHSLARAFVNGKFLIEGEVRPSTISFLKKYEPFRQFLEGGKFTAVPSIFERASEIEILITSQEQADGCFDAVKKFIHEKNYQPATDGLNILILSIAHGTLPYSEARFAAYKEAFLSLISRSQDPRVPWNMEPDLHFSAGKIIEFMSETQNNPEAAEAYAMRLIEEACKFSDARDVLSSLLGIWCKFHKKRGSLGRGIAYVEKIARSLAMKPNIELLLVPSATAVLEIFFDRKKELGVPFVIAKGREIINLLFSHTFSAMSEYALSHQQEIIEYVETLVHLSLKDWTLDADQNKETEIMMYYNALKNGIQGIVELSEQNLAKEIAEFTCKIGSLMNPDQVHEFLQEVQEKLSEHNFFVNFKFQTPSELP